ncbi:MAG: hypothetical protein L6461_21295 [Anaerolineae bacterium]|nr:hypothetical protein [Anaerolineae bacterium]
MKRPQLTNSDRFRLVFLSHFTTFWKKAIHIVQPDTLLRWHRELFGMYWRKKSQGKPKISAETIALIANGSHGKREKIGGLTCQACQTGFSRRRNTPLYRLKTPSQVVEKVILLEAHGVETSVLEDVYQVRESTITNIIKHTSLALSPIISRAANKWLIIETAIIFFGKD